MKIWIWFQMLAWTVAHHFCFHAHCKLLMGIRNSPFIFPIVSNMLPKSKEYGLCIASSTFQAMAFWCLWVFILHWPISSWMTQHHLVIGWLKFNFFWGGCYYIVRSYLGHCKGSKVISPTFKIWHLHVVWGPCSTTNLLIKENLKSVASMFVTFHPQW